MQEQDQDEQVDVGTDAAGEDAPPVTTIEVDYDDEDVQPRRTKDNGKRKASVFVEEDEEDQPPAIRPRTDGPAAAAAAPRPSPQPAGPVHQYVPMLQLSSLPTAWALRNGVRFKFAEWAAGRKRLENILCRGMDAARGWGLPLPLGSAVVRVRTIGVAVVLEKSFAPIPEADDLGILVWLVTVCIPPGFYTAYPMMLPLDVMVFVRACTHWGESPGRHCAPLPGKQHPAENTISQCWACFGKTEEFDERCGKCGVGMYMLASAVNPAVRQWCRRIKRPLSVAVTLYIRVTTLREPARSVLTFFAGQPAPVEPFFVGSPLRFFVQP